MDREVTSLLSWLVSKGCHVNQTWLSDCVNFFRSEHQQYTKKQVEDFAYDQWLLADLRDMGGTASFPPDLQSHIKITLQGKMACQVEYLIDIGHSSYSQIQKIRNEDVGNLTIKDDSNEFQQAWEPKYNRMISLSVCDGVQTIRAVEYKPIPKLNCNLIPGTKVLVVGPVQCRRGVLLLEDRNLIILGGEVDALVISNAYENILARKLRLSENPEPYKSVNRTDLQSAPAIQTEPSPAVQPPVSLPQHEQRRPQMQLSSAPQSVMRQPSGFCTAQNSSGPQKKLIQPPLPWARTKVGTVAQKQTANAVTTNLKSISHHQTDVIMDVDDWDEEGEFEREMASLDESKFSNQTASVARNSLAPSANNIPFQCQNEFDMGSDDEELFLRAEANALMPKDTIGSSIQNKPLNKPLKEAPNCNAGLHSRSDLPSLKRPASGGVLQSLKKPLFTKQTKEDTSSQEVSSTSDVKDSVDDSIQWLDVDESIFEPAAEIISDIPREVVASPYVFLAQLINFKTNCDDVFRVKAAVITVVDKLKIVDDNWQLSVKIADGSASMTVQLSSKVLEEIIGMTASDLQQMKREMNQQSSIKEVVRKKLETAQRRLISLNCFMDIQTPLISDSLPTVVGLEELSSSAVASLRARSIVKV